MDGGVMVLGKAGRIVALLLLFALFSSSVSAAQITASSDKTIYAIDDILKVEGTVNSTASVNLDATFYHDNGTNFYNLTTTSEDKNFDFSYTLDVDAGGYYILITDGTNFVPVHFRVVPETIRLEAHLINSTTIVPVNTSQTITNDTQYGGNFTELLDLSISKTLHYGTANIDTKTYHFVLVDQNLNESYDTLYVDDDKIFQLYNDTEDNETNPDVEIVLKKGDPFNDYIIGEMDFSSGKTVLLAKPRETPTYSPGNEVRFVVLSKNVAGDMVPTNVNVTLLDKNRNIINSITNTTNDFGYFVSSFTAPSAAGFHTISLNDSLGLEVFSVETFKLSAKITDLNDNPTGVFSSNPTVRITAISKTISGELINLTSPANATIYYPNGTSQTITLTQISTGVYSHDLELRGAPAGEYGVRISGASESSTEEIFLGFAIKSVVLELFAINVELFEENAGPESGVKAFAPGKNVTLLAMLSNISAGGFRGGDPQGVIDIDNPSTPDDECRNLTKLVRLKDDRGVSYLQNVTPIAMNLSNFIQFHAPQAEEAPTDALRQCVLMFPASDRTGVYRADVEVTHDNEKTVAGETFGIQRLYASGSTVDFYEKDFALFAPNSTVRIKLKAVDLETLEELNASSIKDAKIIRIKKHFPEYRELSLGNISGENINQSILSFTAPSEEGFFSLKFRFKADVNGTIEKGAGKVFFMLKKYLIWGDVQCERSPCFVGKGKNITLNINMVDVEQGRNLDKGIQTNLTCTDCDGLVVSITELRNEQLGRVIPQERFNITGGFVVGGQAQLKIIPVGKGLPTGWYGAELLLTRLGTDETYHGSAWFEIRNLFVEMVGIKEEDEKFVARGGPATYPLGGDVIFGIIPRNPKKPHVIPGITDIKVKNVLVETWPPIEASYENVTFSEREVYFEWDPETPVNITVANLTGLQKQGNYRANVWVKTDIGSDIGPFHFDLSSYQLKGYYRGVEDWPPEFSSSENLTVNLSAYDFNWATHNLSEAGTKLNVLYDIKRARPVRVNSWTDCVENNCTIKLNLSSLKPGEYVADLIVNDSQGARKHQGIYFVVQELVVSLPNIREAWVGWTDSPKRTLHLDESRDLCFNEKWLKRDKKVDWNATRHLSEEHPGVDLQVDDCPSDATKVCTDSLGLNKNFTLSKKAGSNYYATIICVFNNGTIDGNWGACGEDNRTAIVANSTDVWINNTGLADPLNVVNMTGITPNDTGDTAIVRGRSWYVYDTLIEGTYNRTGVRDKNLTRIYVSNGTDDSPRDIVIPDIPNRDAGLYAGAYCFYNNGTIAEEGDQLCSPGEGTDYYFVSNGTNATIWVYNNLTEPITNGTANVSFGGYTIVDVGYNGNGDPEAEKFRIINTSQYGKIKVGDDTIKISYRYPKAFGKGYCIDQYGEWRGGACTGNGSTVYAVSNYTHLWVNNVTDTRTVMPVGVGEDFNIPGDSREWHVVSVGGMHDERFEVSLSGDKICGRGHKDCTEDGCTEFPYTLVAPSNYSNFYHGYIRDMKRDEHLGDWFGAPFNQTKWAYVYHNTTHVWITNNSVNASNMSGLVGKTIGETLDDPYDGKWEVISISKNRVKLYGKNVLGKSGAYVNTSLSKSGFFNIHPVEEKYLGGWDPVNHRERGMDLDGDGYTNSTVYMAISDNSTTGLYDTFFFSVDSNMSQPISLYGNRTERTFGVAEKLTLLSIDPRANKVRVYSNKTGDWPNLGKHRLGSNVTIPMIVTAPNGTAVEANVTISNVDVKNETAKGLYSLSTPITKTIDGIGELSINLSAEGYGPARFRFEIAASKDGQVQGLEEWKWPKAKMVTFLVKSHTGMAGYVDGFTPLNLTRYDWEAYGKVEEIWTINRSSSLYFEGVFSHEHWDIIIREGSRVGNESEACPENQIIYPLDAGTSSKNFTFKSERFTDPQYYFYINDANASKVWAQVDSCNFSLSNTTTHTTGEEINITLDGKLYNLYVLYANASQSGDMGNDIFIGVTGINSSIIEPMKIDEWDNRASPKWAVMAVNISGTSYHIILANDSSLDYPLCAAWNLRECIKKAWFSTTGNFTNASLVRIGDNFTSELYLARVGPGPWEGITIGNFSQIQDLNLPHLPGVDARVRDGTESYFAKLNESKLGMDLNLDGEMKTFYALTFDEREDGLQNLTHVLVDDDLNMTEEWWNDGKDDPTYLDFYGNETNKREFHGRLPRRIGGSGHIRFGPRVKWNETEMGSIDLDENGQTNDTFEAPWEYQPEWDIKVYNITHALLVKDKHRINVSDNITFAVRAYNFDQSPIEEANVSLMEVIGMTPIGFMVLNDSKYTVENVQNVTDSYGYAIIKLAPASEWYPGEYMAVLSIDTSVGREKVKKWFKVTTKYELR